MRTRPRPRSVAGLAALAATLVLLACGGPPTAPVASTLSPGKGDSAARVRGAFAVVFAGPRGEVSDTAEPAITVLFNRAMRDPDAQDTAGLPPLRLEASGAAAVAGSWRWVGTHGLLFTPERALPGSTRFQVTVPAGARSLEGEVLTADYAFEFATARPKVVEAEPPDGASDLKPDTKFRVRFNQPMTAAALNAGAHLRVVTKPGEAPRDVALRARHPKTGKAPDKTLVLTPAESLPKDAAIELVLDAALHGEGPLTATASRTLRFRTYGPLALASIVCPRNGGPRCEAHRDFTVVLSNAVDPQEFKAHLRAPELRFVPPAKVAHAVKKKPPPTTNLLVAADPDFGKRYHVTLTKGLTDVFGQKLEHDLSFDVDTEAPWVAGGKSVGDGRAAAARPHDDGDPQGTERAFEPSVNEAVPHRARLDYRVDLGISGHVVEALARTGMKAHRVPVGAVNVPTYGLFDQKLDEDEALAWLEQRGGRGPGGVPFRWSWVSPNAPENVWDVRSIDLDALLGGPGRRGAALLAIDRPGESSDRSTLLTVTDLAVSADVSRFGSLVWITRLSTGAPVGGAVVAVRGLGKADVAPVTTGPDGLASFPAGDWFEGRADDGPGRAHRVPYLFVRAGDDWTYSSLSAARANYGSGVDLDIKSAAEWAGMIYADRGVYRPGETMKVAGVFRKVDAAGVKIVPAEDARVLVEDAQGEKVFDGRAKLGAFGELALDVPLPKTSHLGSASIKVELGRKEAQSFAESVVLAAYKASEFKVGVEPEQPEYVRGDAGSFDLHAEYLFGAPMSGASFRTSVLRHASRFVPARSEGFVTTDDAFALDHPETSPAATELADSSGTLDETGHSKVPVAFALSNMRGPEEVVLEAEVTDLSHETVAKRASVLVHPAAFYLGIGALPSRFVAVGANVSVQVAALEPKGAHVAGVAAKVELVERVWTSATIDESADVPRRQSRVHDEVVATCDVKTTTAAATCSIRVPKPGYYLLRAGAKDARGNATGASTGLYCLSDRSDVSVSWAPPGTSRRLKLETDKKLYRAGDVAKVLIQNPFKKAEALVTVERGGVLDQHVVALEGPMPVVDVDVKPEYFPNAFVSVRLVRGRVADAPAAGADLGAPDFRLGLVSIAVDPATHRLTPTITTSRKEYAPGDEVVADVVVRGNDGKAGRGEVTFYAVDEGVLMLTGYETPDPLPAFSQDRKLSVFAVESREELAHLLPLKNGERIRPLGYDYLSPTGGDKGGDGGGGGEGGPRFDFKTTAFFEAGKVTDDEGRVRYQFKLPDNLTTFRLMAIVAGADDRFGKGEAEVVTSKRLMARPVMPRIVRVGDRFEAGVLVSSKDLPATTARVTVTAKGVATTGPATREVAVPKGGSVEVRFPFVAMANGPASFAFTAEGGGAKDQVAVTRTIELPVSVETVSTYGETKGPVAVALGDLSRVRPDQGGLEVHLASTALVGLGTSFDELVEYPYGCTEQLTSRILPLLVLPELARAVGAHLPARVPDAIDEGIGHLLEHQDEQGGFSFWGDGGSAEPWLSAYAMLAVEGAAEKGLFVPKEARDHGVAYLREILDHAVPAEDGKSEADATEDADSPAREGKGTKEKRRRAYAQMTFVADALATLGQIDPATLNRLFEARAHRPLFTQALLLHAMAIAHMPVSELDTVAGEIVPRVRVEADDAYADEVVSGYEDLLDSSTRTSALVLRALVAAHPDHPLASRLAHGLLRRREGGGWRSTQENVWALLALDDYRRAQESATPDFDARVFLGGKKLGEAHFHGGSSADQPVSADMRQVFPAAGRILTFDVVGTGKLFYSAELRTASVVLPARPRDAGMYVQKLLRAVEPSQLAAAQKVLPQRGESAAAPGNLVLVDLLLESAEPREQVVIDDPLPAGLEPIDFALDTSAESTRVDDDGPHPGDKHTALFQYGVAFRSPGPVHREQHDDRVLTFLSHLEPGLYHFRYLARATTPGDFVVPPTRATCMYSPEVWGASAATRFVVGAPVKSPSRAVAANP